MSHTHAASHARRPNLFIIGAPKCGTTSLYEYLYGHPDVYMSPVKEPFYFSPDVNRESRRGFRFGENEAQYLALFGDAQHERWRGEASTRYLMSEAAPRLVHEFAPEARIIAMFRDPVDMIHAMHNERTATGEEDIADFEQAVGADDDRRAGRRLPPGGNRRGAVYRENARFATHLRRWLEAYPTDQVHVILLDDLVSDPGGTLRRVLRFLNVDESYAPASLAARNTSYRRRAGPIGAVMNGPIARWTAHVLLPRAIGRNASFRLARRIRHSPLFRRPNPRPAMAESLRLRLRDELRPEVEDLGRLLGRDLVTLWWGRVSSAATVPVPPAPAVRGE